MVAVLLALSLVINLVNGEPRRDHHPIESASGSAIYLDGPDWTASGVTRDFKGDCSYQEDTDYSPGSGIKPTPIAYNFNAAPTGGSVKQCCYLCAASPSCTASVWDGRGCTFKTIQEMGNKTVTKGSTACLPGTTARPLTINATVPGDLVTDLQKAGLTPDPLRGVNYANASLWAGAC